MAISKLNNKKVPALALVLVAVVGMVAGVLAANLLVTHTSTNGEVGTLHTSTGNVTVTDDGLGVVANSVGSALTGTFATTSQVNTATTAGNWFYKLAFADTFANDAASHVITVTIRNGVGIEPATLVTPAVFTIASASPNTGIITAYIDLGTNQLTSPITVYVSST
jgi:hypothetical protein